MLSAVIFDLDGTLVDTNDMHVRAWKEALVAHGYNVADDRIGVEIGKGGDHLVPDLLGAKAEAHDGETLRREHDRAYARIANREGILVLSGARELIAAVRAEGLRVALATSSNRDGIALCEKTSGVAWRDLFDEVIDADDVERSKPSPDVVARAVEVLGVSPCECAMIGDTPWDASSAMMAGVIGLGVTCGGNTKSALLAGGMRLVQRDPADVLADLGGVLARLSPSTRRLDRDLLAELMGAALDAASAALDAGEAPIGCVIADSQARVIATGYNRFVATGDRAAHAEIVALHAAGARLPERDAIVVSTLEPCVMCTGAMMQVAADTVIYGLEAPADSGTKRVRPPTGPDNQMPRIAGGIRRAECRKLFEDWLTRPDRCRAQEPYIRTLLGP